jgi:5-methylcytosine-specific restriction protein A
MPKRAAQYRPNRPASASGKAAYERGRAEDKRFYCSARWRKFRRWFLSLHPLCADCGRPAEEIHHVQPLKQRPDLALAPENALQLCVPCHSKRTRAEAKGGTQPEAKGNESAFFYA